MKLRESKFLFIDCQTTGMRPPAAHLLEIAWGSASANQDSIQVDSHLVALPNAGEIPHRVKEITGIADEEMRTAKSIEDVFNMFKGSLTGDLALIHYAQFEKPFLLDLFARFENQSQLPFQVLCTHQLTKRVLPNLPSQNIRGAAGFFGIAPGGLKRAPEHVRATHQIWRGLLSELEKQGVETLTQLEELLTQRPKKKASKYEYRLDRLKRLELPDCPGIYRMVSKSGEILYVGKATSLKSRVNSYFRGFKGRDRRKLEMLAQVWDLKVTTCATPLEAALLETDEIKRYNPPYNVVLKRGRRHLMFYNHDFSTASQTCSGDFPHGPFRNSNWIEHLRLLFRSLSQETFEQIFFNPIAPEILRQGWELFCTQQKLGEVRSVRSLLAQGMWLLKNYVEPIVDEEEIGEEPEEEAEDRDPTPEEIAGKFERLLRRSAAEFQRTKKLSRLLNARITFTTPKGDRFLNFHRGSIANSAEEVPSQSNNSWEGLGIDDFDRMSILLSELQRYEHEIMPDDRTSTSGSR